MFWVEVCSRKAIIPRFHFEDFIFRKKYSLKRKQIVCWWFILQIVLDNKAHSGKVKIRLENQATIKECKDPSVSGQGKNQMKICKTLLKAAQCITVLDSCAGVMPSLCLTKTALSASLPSPAENYTRLAFDVAVALVCMLSLLLCGRSILRGIMLQQVGEGHVVEWELWILALWFTAQNWSRRSAHSLKPKPCFTIGGCANSKCIHVCFSLHVQYFSMSPSSLPVSVWLLGVCAVL